MKIGGILNDASTNDAGKAQADGMHFLALGDRVDLLLDAVADVFRGHGLQSVQRSAFLRINAERAGEFVVLHEADRDVFHYEYADGFGHCCRLPQFVKTVEGGGFVAFRQRR